MYKSGHSENLNLWHDNFLKKGAYHQFTKSYEFEICGPFGSLVILSRPIYQYTKSFEMQTIWLFGNVVNTNIPIYQVS